MNERRGNWYLLTGLVIGLAIGLIYAWVISPVKYVDTAPASLAAPYKDAYRRVIALAYRTDHNIDRARERLKLIDQASPVQALAAQAQRMIAAKQPAEEARALAVLAADMGKPQGAVTPTGQTAVAAQEETATVEPSPLATMAVDQAILTATLPLPTVTPTITLTPTATLTLRPTFAPRPTATIIPTLGAPFKLTSKSTVCDSSITPGLLEIQVNDADGKPMPGVQIQVTWQDGDSTFYTGLAPDISRGYADFLMAAGVKYALRVGETSKPVEDLSIPDCGGGWIIEFQSMK